MRTNAGELMLIIARAQNIERLAASVMAARPPITPPEPRAPMFLLDEEEDAETAPPSKWPAGAINEALAKLTPKKTEVPA